MSGTRRIILRAVLTGVLAVACWGCALLTVSSLEREYGGVSVRLAEPSVTRQALENAARVGRGQWVFDRLAEGFTQSSVDGRPPWDVLRAMGDELALPELDDLANIMALAEQQTMPVYQTLREHNRALRVALLTDEQARANAASERLTIPATMLAIVFIAILLGPSLMTLMSNT